MEAIDRALVSAAVLISSTSQTIDEDSKMQFPALIVAVAALFTLVFSGNALTDHKCEAKCPDGTTSSEVCQDNEKCESSCDGGASTRCVPK